MLRILILLACLQPLVAQPAAYFPARNDWQRSDPAAAGTMTNETQLSGTGYRAAGPDS